MSTFLYPYQREIKRLIEHDGPVRVDINQPSRRIGQTHLHRLQAHLCAVASAEARGIALDLQDIAQLEDTVRRMAPAYIRPGQDVHFITTRYKRQRFTVLFNALTGYIISIGVARPLVSEPRWMLSIDELHRQEEDARP